MFMKKRQKIYSFGIEKVLLQNICKVVLFQYEKGQLVLKKYMLSRYSSKRPTVNHSQ